MRVAAIGSGARGSDLIRALSTIDNAQIVGVADDYPPHLEQGLKYAGPQAQPFADYRRMLADLKPAAVVIAVPLHLHFPIATACLDAGCDVFLEKTMCRTIDEAEQLGPPCGRIETRVSNRSAAPRPSDLSASGGDDRCRHDRRRDGHQSPVASQQQLAAADSPPQDRSAAGPRSNGV